MADWKVFRDQIITMPHGNALNLEVGKVGNFPVVFQKGLYQTGQVVIFIPEKSILPENLQEGFKQYLHGNNKDRVGSVTLRGEISMGIMIPDRPEFADVPFGEDISAKLGITKYEPPIPAQLHGFVQGFDPCNSGKQTLRNQHDVEQFTINASEFKEGEEVICTEKIHGCFHPDTPVLLGNGKYRNISEIKVGDEVMSYNAEDFYNWSSIVTNTFRQPPAKDWLTLSFEEDHRNNGKVITCTTDHKFLTHNRGWIEADKLLESDDLASASFMKLIKKQYLTEKYDRCDIEVAGNHNYVANGVVVHNSQLIAIRDEEGGRHVSSKGLFKTNLTIKEDEKNFYWLAVRNTGIFELIDKWYGGKNVSVFSEGFACQKGYSYDATKPTLRIFDIRIDGVSQHIDSIPEEIKKLFVPILYRGPFHVETIMKLREGMEQVSGTGANVREGLVLRPVVDRYSSGKNPFRLMVKIINPAYLKRQTGEEFN